MEKVLDHNLQTSIRICHPKLPDPILIRADFRTAQIASQKKKIKTPLTQVHNYIGLCSLQHITPYCTFFYSCFRFHSRKTHNAASWSVRHTFFKLFIYYLLLFILLLFIIISFNQSIIILKNSVLDSSFLHTGVDCKSTTVTSSHLHLSIFFFHLFSYNHPYLQYTLPQATYRPTPPFRKQQYLLQSTLVQMLRR